MVDRSPDGRANRDRLPCGQTRDELEALLRRIILQRAEGPKVDFKRELTIADKAGQAELAKDLSSIANTDDDVHYDDVGYVILGASPGSLTGSVTTLAGDIDGLQARLTEVMGGFLAPALTISTITGLAGLAVLGGG